MASTGSTARMAAAVVAGVVIWAVLWVGGSAIGAAVRPDVIVAGQRLEHRGALLGYLLYSVVVSVISGFITTKAAHDTLRAAYILAGIQLALGLVIEISAWDMTPAWYHVVFLALLVPTILFGARLAVTRA